MSSSRPFFTAPTGEFDTEQILDEARPLAKLIGAVVVVALVPVCLQILLFDILPTDRVFVDILPLVTQFILAVGTGIVLMYVIVRSNQLMDE